MGFDWSENRKRGRKEETDLAEICTIPENGEMVAVDEGMRVTKEKGRRRGGACSQRGGNTELPKRVRFC